MSKVAIYHVYVEEQVSDQFEQTMKSFGSAVEVDFQDFSEVD